MANKKKINRKTKKSYNKRGGASTEDFSDLFNEAGQVNWDTNYPEEKSGSSTAKIGVGAIVIVGTVFLGLALAKKL